MRHNEIVRRFIDDNGDDILLARCTDRIGYCQAWQGEMHGLYVLQSYNTIVAVYDSNKNVIYDFLRYVYSYTATSAKHISKFINRHYDSDTKIYRYRVVQ